MSHVLFSYEFDAKGGGIPLEGDNISTLIKDKKLAWVHLDAGDPGTKSWLEKELDYLDPFVIKALLEEETRPRMTEVGDGALVVLRGVNLNKDSDPEDMVSVRLWIDESRIISVRMRRLRAILDIEAKLKNGRGPKNSADFITMLTTRLFERMEPTINKLHETIDELEQIIMDTPDLSIREDILSIRKKAIMFRRHMSPQREAIDRLRMSDLAWLDGKHVRQLQESYNHVTRYVEDLDSIRERAQIIKDELMSILSDKLNKNMYILSVIAAIFLPLGFLTGLLGINVGGIPGADDPEAFYTFCGILCVIVLLQVIIFKKLKWF